MSDAISPRDRLIVALDVPGAAEARDMIARLGDSVSFYKIGMELIYGGAGFDMARALIAEIEAGLALRGKRNRAG